MEANTMDCDTPTALRFLASSAKQAEAEWMRKAADEIERLVGLAAFSSPDMVKWLTDQVMRRDNVIEAMKSAGIEQITKAFTENRWIPITERLPELGVDVLVYNTVYETVESSTLMDFDGCVAFRDDDLRKVEASHWMPLPEPPEAK